MKKIITTATLLLALLSTNLAVAGTVKLPADKPAAAITIPDDWSPEKDDDGNVLAESPDNTTTVYFEIVANEKEMDTAVESSVTWLMEEHEVKVDAASQEEKEFTDDTGRKWHRISWSGDHKEHGPAVVGFLFTEVGQDKVLTLTYWINKKGAEKSLEALGGIFNSVKNLE